MRRGIALNVLLMIGACTLAGCGKRDAGEKASSQDGPAAQDTPVTRTTPDSEISLERINRIIAPFNKGIALMDQFKPVEAVAAFEEVVRLEPEWITGRLNLGIALLNSQTDEGYARAEEELKWVLERSPENPVPFYALGMLLRHLTRFDEAKTMFETVLQLDPEDGDAHYQLAILILENEPEAARAHLEKTLDKIPHHESACYRLATLLRKLGEKEESKAMFGRFKVLKAKKAGVFSGMKYGEMGRYASVIRAFDEPGSRDVRSDIAPAYRDVAAAWGLKVATLGAPAWPGTPASNKALAFAPGVAVADIRGAGHLAVYWTGSASEQGGALYEFKNGQFVAVPDPGINGKQAIGAYFGDYDRDGDPDLFLTCVGPNRLYRNEGDGRFADVTSSSGVGGEALVSVGAAWADADHDGDLDLYVANFSSTTSDTPGAPNKLWRNNGDGTFVDVATGAGIHGGDSATVGILYFDFDDDRDLDLYLINHESPNRLFLNDRVGQYTDATEWFPQLADDGPGCGALRADMDQNGRPDLLLLRGPRPPRLFLQVDRGQFEEDTFFASATEKIGGVASAIIADLDLDGDQDLVLLSAGVNGKHGHRVLMNTGYGQFSSPVLLGEEHSAPDARGALAVDFDGDGALELLVARVGAVPQVWRTSPPQGMHWLSVIPMKSADEEALWPSPDANGLTVEIKAGLQLQIGAIAGSEGYLSALPRRVHFGMGTSEKADYVRLVWPDGVLQSELEVPVDHVWRITKMLRKPSSCPILFAWDGERFAFVTDFLGVGGMGFFMAPGEYAPPDPTEDVLIPPEQVAVREGQYLLRITEPLEEVTYLDQLHLQVYDHPAEWEIYPDERFTGSPPFPTGRPSAVTKKIFPQSAENDRGVNLQDRIRSIDRRYVEPPLDDRFVGYARDHWLELDFGDQLRNLDPGVPLILYLYGWVEYTYSHINYAAYQAGITMRSPYMEIPDGSGGWKIAVPEIGFPAGLPRMMTLDISKLPVRKDGRFRIRTNMEIFWDQVFVGQDVSGRKLITHTLEPEMAVLRQLGYPREYSPDGSNPTVYDYHRLDQGVPFKNLTGHFTRFGDVRPLLKAVDDQFVIMARGEEMALAFDSTALPALPAGWSRTLVLHSDGYCKDMDLYTAFPDTVAPLPYHAMENYPPASPRPPTPAYRAYQATWNTRHIAGR